MQQLVARQAGKPCLETFRGRAQPCERRSMYVAASAGQRFRRDSLLDNVEDASPSSRWDLPRVPPSSTSSPEQERLDTPGSSPLPINFNSRQGFVTSSSVEETTSQSSWQLPAQSVSGVPDADGSSLAATFRPAESGDTPSSWDSQQYSQPQTGPSDQAQFGTAGWSTEWGEGEQPTDWGGTPLRHGSRSQTYNGWGGTHTHTHDTHTHSHT
jgi:hypothetical protein